MQICVCAFRLVGGREIHKQHPFITLNGRAMQTADPALDVAIDRRVRAFLKLCPAERVKTKTNKMNVETAPTTPL
jgi:hypothetical protein